MEIPLNAHEARVLGCLLEKAATTPEYYPLTMNALVNACNQKSSREPVMELEEDEVQRAVEGLRNRRLVYRVDVAGSRVPKYRYDLDVLAPLEDAEKALLAVLLLRGFQTPGELRARCERMYLFPDTESVLRTLKSLAEDYDEALVMVLPRQPGRKEARWSHLLSGVPEVSAEPEVVVVSDSVYPTSAEQEERWNRQEARIEELERQVLELTQAFDRFRSQFE